MQDQELQIFDDIKKYLISLLFTLYGLNKYKLFIIIYFAIIEHNWSLCSRIVQLHTIRMAHI